MPVSFDVLDIAFFDKIAKDKKFFSYFNLTTEEAIELATQRADVYLKEAISRFILKCASDITLDKCDFTERTIDVDLTIIEIDILSNFMYERYLSRDFAKLSAINVNFTPKDLQVFSPSNDKKAFLEMYEKIKLENKDLIASYAASNRSTGQKKYIPYDSYEDE